MTTKAKITTRDGKTKDTRQQTLNKNDCPPPHSTSNKEENAISPQLTDKRRRIGNEHGLITANPFGDRNDGNHTSIHHCEDDHTSAPSQEQRNDSTDRENQNNGDKTNQNKGDTDSETNQAPRILSRCNDVPFVFPSDSHVIMTKVLQGTTDAQRLRNTKKKFMCVKIIHATRHIENNQKNFISFSNKKGDFGSGQKAFDRMIFYYDVTDKNKQIAATIFETSPNQEMDNLRVNDNSIIGQTVILNCPLFENFWFYGNIPVLKLQSYGCLISIRPGSAFDNLKTKIPITPDVSNTMKIFSFPKTSVELISISYFPSCSNAFCDRTTEYPDCFCLQKNKTEGLGMSVSLIFCDNEKTNKDNWYAAKNYKSYRFQKLFLPSNMTVQLARKNAGSIFNHIDQKINEITNSDEKFFLQGWFKRGMKKVDDNKYNHDLIDSDQIQPHIHILTPNRILNPETMIWKPREYGVEEATYINSENSDNDGEYDYY